VGVFVLFFHILASAERNEGEEDKQEDRRGNARLKLIRVPPTQAAEPRLVLRAGLHNL